MQVIMGEMMHEDLVKKMYTTSREDSIRKLVSYSKADGKLEEDLRNELYAAFYYAYLSCLWKYLSFALIIFIIYLLWG